MPTLSDLTPIQIRTLIKLDTPGGDVDSVGRRIEELSPKNLLAALHLIPMGCVVRSIGWRSSLWFRLTPRGRAIREDGAA